MNVITSSIVNNQYINNNIFQLPISGTLINNVQQWFDKFYIHYSQSITIGGQNSYQYLFDEACRITNDKLLLDTPLGRLTLARIKELFNEDEIISNNNKILNS